MGEVVFRFRGTGSSVVGFGVEKGYVRTDSVEMEGCVG